MLRSKPYIHQSGKEPIDLDERVGSLIVPGKFTELVYNYSESTRDFIFKHLVAAGTRFWKPMAHRVCAE